MDNLNSVGDMPMLQPILNWHFSILFEKITRAKPLVILEK
jgi:hypothetical protein